MILRSTPTSGERRSAARMLPFLVGVAFPLLWPGRRLDFFGLLAFDGSLIGASCFPGRPQKTAIPAWRASGAEARAVCCLFGTTKVMP